MARVYDTRTGRPLEGSAEAVETLSDRELDVELVIAAVARGRLRMERLGVLRDEQTRRRSDNAFGAVAAPEPG